jgi:membrane protein required for colicin V production
VNWFDVLLLLICLASVAAGFKQGFVRLGIGFAAVVAGFLLAAWFYGTAGNFVEPFVQSRIASNIIGFLMVLFGVMVLGGILGWIAAKAFKLVGLSWLDRLAGGAFGAVRGAVVCVAILMVTMAFTSKPPKVVAESQIAPYLAGAAHAASRLAPYEIRYGAQKGYNDLRRMWDEVMKKQPEEKRRSI